MSYSYSPSSCDYLMHHGVKGMKWGVRKDKTSFSTRRMAKKDAKEFARAKMFYGEGAGNRRKLIKNTVNQRSKDIPGYKKEFEKRLANQDMAKHVQKAKGERKRADVKKSAGKTARGIMHLVLKDGAPVAASVAAAYGIAKATGADRVIKNNAKVAYENAKVYAQGVKKMYKNKK